MKPIYRSLLFVVAVSASADLLAEGAVLRVACDGDAVDAEVLVNGQFKGECPLDVQVPAGTLKLRVQKKIDTLNERVFEQELRLGDGAVKRIDVQLSPPQLTAEAKKREAERSRQEQAAKKRTEARQRAVAEKQARAPAQTSVQAAVEPKVQGIALGSGSAFRDCTDCPEMVLIPGGSFEMGSPSHEAGRRDNEGPVHRVNVSSFAMGRNAVTRRQFSAFVTETGYDVGDKCWTFENGRGEVRQGRSWRDVGYPQDDNHPAVCVSWNDAIAYAQWISLKTGKNYRLASEAEWEYAARANTTTARFWGESPDQACAYANVMDATGKSRVPDVTWEAHNCSDGHAYTSPVGSFKPNAFGLYDMLGNVWQWTQDCWHDNYNGAPTDGSAWAGGDCGKHAVRGGSWNLDPRFVRAAVRSDSNTGGRSRSLGFRLARTLP